MARKRKPQPKPEKEYFALNTQLFLPILMFLLFLGFGIFSIVWGGDEGAIMLGVILLLFVPLSVFAFLVSPVGYLFSSEHVTILYVLGDRETILWRSVRWVVRYGSWISKGGGLPHYSLSYPNAQKRRFYVKGEISVTHRTKCLMKRFCRREIL